MISFCIPAHNEEALIGATVASIAYAARTLALEHEIIVASDASTDRTAQIARAGGARVVEIDKRHIAGARNAAAKEAKGDILVFVDADTVVSAELVQAALVALENGAAGGGAIVAMEGRVPWHGRVMLAGANAIMRALNVCGGCFVFCTRAAFDAAGGFDEQFYAGEELAFAKAIKQHGRFVIVPKKVMTSGRKTRTHSMGEMMSLLARGVVRGKKLTSSREGLDLWYGPRREDPGGAGGAGAAGHKRKSSNT